jgi:hypothetical protein
MLLRLGLLWWYGDKASMIDSSQSLYAKYGTCQGASEKIVSRNREKKERKFRHCHMFG